MPPWRRLLLHVRERYLPNFFVRTLDSRVRREAEDLETGRGQTGVLNWPDVHGLKLIQGLSDTECSPTIFMQEECCANLHEPGRATRFDLGD